MLIKQQMPATDAVIQKKTTLINSNIEIEDIIKIVKSLENTGLLIKSVTEAIKNKAKKQKGVFVSMLLGTLAAS